MPMRDATRGRLSPEKGWLVDVMRQLSFGRIEGLAVRGGEPAREPEPRVVRTVKLGGADRSPRPELGSRDFALKREVVELLDECARLGEGVIGRIEVKGGVPFLAEIVQAARE
jgi:hypothetical protein